MRTAHTNTCQSVAAFDLHEQRVSIAILLSDADPFDFAFDFAFDF